MLNLAAPSLDGCWYVGGREHSDAKDCKAHLSQNLPFCKEPPPPPAFNTTPVFAPSKRPLEKLGLSVVCSLVMSVEKYRPSCICIICQGWWRLIGFFFG
jgi:hypothetical protein